MQQSNRDNSLYCTLSDQELIAICTEWIQKLIDSGGKEWCMFVPARPNKDPDLLLSELVERFKAKLSEPQSEGGLQWVSCGIRFPEDIFSEIVRYKPTKGLITEESVKAVEAEYFEMEDGSRIYYEDCEWLDESASLSTANTETVNDELYLALVTLVRMLGTKHRSAEETRYWESAQGICAKYHNPLRQPANTEEGAGVPWEKIEQTLYDLYSEKGLANAASKAHSTVWLWKYSAKEKSESKSKEQQIAFAEWVLDNKYVKRPDGNWFIDGSYSPLPFDLFSSAELYELFLTEAKQQ